MIPIINPFVINTYYGNKYFCDREEQTKDLIAMLTNGNNVVISGERRIGKTNFISHVFAQPEISDVFTTIEVDIYSAKSLNDFVEIFGKAILRSLKSKGRQFVESFISYIKSLKPSMSLDSNGNPTWSIGADTKAIRAEITLDEIFEYIEKSDRPIIVAIDEFQRITRFSDPDKVEALLRTYIQKCTNSLFVFCGSDQRLLTQMFFTSSRPFYQAAMLMSLPKLNLEVYTDFCIRLFKEREKDIDKDTVSKVYKMADGITANMQKILNMLFYRTNIRGLCLPKDIEPAIDNILKNSQDVYASYYNLLTIRQRQVVSAIAHEGLAVSVLSVDFITKYHLGTPSMVQSAITTLLDNDVIFKTDYGYSLNDFFFSLWLKRL